MRWLWLAVLLFHAAPAVAAQNDPGGKSSPGITLRMGRRPSLRLGKIARIDFRLKFQGDFRGFSPQLETKAGLFDLHRRRIGVEGTFLKHFEYEVERELRREDPWRDVFVNFRYLRDFQIKAGKFKLPFSLDQLTAPADLDFIFRSRAAELLSPGRDLGITAHGRFFRRGLHYEGGLFLRDGENARLGDNPGAERTFAARVTGAPLRLLPLPSRLKTIELGGAFTSSTVPEGPKGLPGRMISRRNIFPDPDPDLRMFVRGQRLRLGAELSWMPGPFSVKGEFLHVRDQRRGQGLRGDDLPDYLCRGWYLAGAWAVTGESKREGLDKPRRDFPRERGPGAVELAMRYEQIRFGSSEHPGRPLRHQRAANILSNSDRVWTFGVNWYWNRWVKIQFNGVRERIEDAQRSPIPGRERFWARLVRLQFVM